MLGGTGGIGFQTCDERNSLCRAALVQPAGTELVESAASQRRPYKNESFVAVFIRMRLLLARAAFSQTRLQEESRFLVAFVGFCESLSVPAFLISSFLPGICVIRENLWMVFRARGALRLSQVRKTCYVWP